MLLSAGLSTFDRPKAWEALKKSVGKEQAKEIEDLVKNFRASGFDQSIDSHTFGADGLVEFSKAMAFDPRLNPHKAALNGIGRKLGDAAKAPVIMARKLGFDMGEHLNLSSTWLMARNKWQKANPGKDWRRFNEEISAQARQYALTMTPIGNFGYQKGWASLATQFLSIQHKTLLTMLGQNNAFTRKEARNIAISQLAMFGTAGWGMHELVRDSAAYLGVQMNPEVLDAITGGASEVIINQGLQAIYDDEDTRVSSSSSLAPASGIFTSAYDIIEKGLTEPSSEVFFGPTTSAMGRFKDVFDNARTIIYLHGNEEDPDMIKKLTTKQLGNVLSLTSQYNNYLQREFVKNTGYFRTKFNDPTVKATLGEALAKMAFGFPSHEEEAYYDLVGTSHSEPKKQGVLDEIAATYISRMEKLTTRMMDEIPANGDDHYYQKLDQASAFVNRLEEELFADRFLIGSLSEADRMYIQLSISKKVKAKMEAGDDKLIRNIVNHSLKGNYGDGVDYVMTKLINSGLATKEETETGLKAVWEFMMEEVSNVEKD
jgi:hypothetical protein